MFLIHEEAWHLAIQTLAKYANGKVTCKERQTEAARVLVELKALQPDRFIKGGENAKGDDCGINGSAKSR